TMLQAAAQLKGNFEFLVPVAPTLEPDWLKQQVGQHPVHLVSDARAALLHSRAGIIASGTATVEAALMGTPFVMVYRVSTLTYILGKPRLKVPYFAMVNLIAGEQVVPELVQDEFTTKNVVDRTREIIEDGPVREQMVSRLTKVRKLLAVGSLMPDSAPGTPHNQVPRPPERAATEILALLSSSLLVYQHPMGHNDHLRSRSPSWRTPRMFFQPRRGRRALILSLFSCLLLAVSAHAAEKMRLRVDDYQIDAELAPHSHKLTVKAKVKFTALDDLNMATFELHNGLRVTKVIDEHNKPLTAERVTQDSIVRVALPSGISKNSTTTLTFDYEGVLDSADDSPVQGLKLASIADDTSYLLYAGRWFPVNGYGINRFTATMHITVPAHMIVVGSGSEEIGNAAASKKPSGGSGATKTYTFVW